MLATGLASTAAGSPIRPAGEAGTSLELAQQFIRSVEAKDLEAVAATLAPGSQQFFLHTSKSGTTTGEEAIVSGRDSGAICVADLEGRGELLAYAQGLFEKFTPLRWVHKKWSASKDGRRVFFRGQGDMTTTSTHRPYRNNYVVVFDIQHNRIVRINEYADLLQYVALGILPNEVEARSLLRACGLQDAIPRRPDEVAH